MKLGILAAVALFAASGSALAQQGPSPEMQAAREAMMKACAADAKTLCDGKTGRDLNMCLRQNTDKASAPCKDAMSKMPAGGPGGGGPRPGN
jgi:cytochrome c556